MLYVLTVCKSHVCQSHSHSSVQRRLKGISPHWLSSHWTIFWHFNSTAVMPPIVSFSAISMLILFLSLLITRLTSHSLTPHDPLIYFIIVLTSFYSTRDNQFLHSFIHFTDKHYISLPSSGFPPANKLSTSKRSVSRHLSVLNLSSIRIFPLIFQKKWFAFFLLLFVMYFVSPRLPST